MTWRRSAAWQRPCRGTPTRRSPRSRASAIARSPSGCSNASPRGDLIIGRLADRRRSRASPRSQTRTSAEVIAVIEVFRAPGRSFLMPPHGVALSGDSVIDISHESLIRQWGQLRTWVEEEAESRATYLRLVEAARLHRAGRAGLVGRARSNLRSPMARAKRAQRHLGRALRALASMKPSHFSAIARRRMPRNWSGSASERKPNVLRRNASWNRRRRWRKHSDSAPTSMPRHGSGSGELTGFSMGCLAAGGGDRVVWVVEARGGEGRRDGSPCPDNLRCSQRRTTRTRERKVGPKRAVLLAASGSSYCSGWARREWSFNGHSWPNCRPRCALARTRQAG